MALKHKTIGAYCAASIAAGSLGCASSAPATRARPWESMDKAALDDAYNNSKAVPESGPMFKEWLARSEKVRAKYADHLDLQYGPRPRNKIDYFSAGQDTPVLVFIHGGFWQMRSKEDFAFLAEPFLNSGVSVAMVGYPLAPDVTMDDIVADAHAAIRWLAAEAPKLGGDPQRMVVSGWSSGGHLATMVLDEPSLRGGVSVSGLFELEPLLKSYVNDKLRMDVAMAKRNSPIEQLPKTSKQLDLFAGSAELSEMRRQTADYAAARRAAGLPTRYEEIAQANHYTILNSMMDEGGTIRQSILTMLGKP